MQTSKLRTAASSTIPASAMVLEFDTSLGDLTVELVFTGAANVLVRWGDGTTDKYTTIGTKTHTYATSGVYTVDITGSLTGFGGTVTPRPELTKCLSFGSLGLQSLRQAFLNCVNLTVVPSTLPATVTVLEETFYGASAFNQNIGGWDVSNVTTMFRLFASTNFDQDIGGWDLSAGPTLSYMFENNPSFNQNIGGWDVSGVSFMQSMFSNASSFNQNLSSWCVGNFQSEPASFATGSALTVGNKPVWGTCPLYIANGSITYIGQSNGVESATLPTHQAGDLIVAFAFRSGSTTLPTSPAGWSFLESAAANTCSARLAYKVAASGSETSGTWTSATTVIFLVYRGVNTSNIDNIDTESTGSGTTVTYNANGFWRGLSRLVTFAGHRSIDTALGTAPGSLTLIVNPVDATDEAAAFQSTVDNFGNWTSTNVSVGGTASGWITFTMRLRVPITPI